MTPEERVQQCTTFEEIKKVVEELGGVQGSHAFYTPDCFNEALDAVIAGKYDVQYITRTYGLRRKVYYLLAFPRKEVEMSKQGVLVRDVTTEECDWLDADLEKGKVVYRYDGYTYGVIGRGIAVSDVLDQTPFYEIPRDAVKWDAE